MNRQKPSILIIPFGQKKLPQAKVMVYQLHSTCVETKNDWTDWYIKAGLFYPKNIPKFREKIFGALAKAQEQEVQLIIFPELSVPEELISEITTWSEGKNMIIVAGSHYKSEKENENPIALAPVIFNGKVKGNTQKIQRAFAEKSAVPHSGLKEGSQINIYTQTPVGDFALLICSDNLDEYEKVKIELKKHQLDFWIVPAFQKKSDEHFDRLTVDVRGKSSRYIIYCNNKNQESDGKSSLFGQTDKKFLNEFIKNGYTDNTPKWKLISLNESTDYFILNVVFENKRPTYGHSVNDEANIEVKIFDSLHEPKNHQTKVDISKKEHFVSEVEKIEKKIKADSVVEHLKTEYSDVDYKIISSNAYQSVLKRIESISDRPNELKDKEFVNAKLIGDLRKSLDEKGVAFITAPIRFGKTFLLKYVQLEFSTYSLVSHINGRLYKVKQSEIKTLHGLYFFWFKKIAESILQEMGLAITKIEGEYIDKIEDEKCFQTWIQNKRQKGESDIQGLIKALAEFRIAVNFNKEILIAFHLDDIHEYTSGDVFQHLRNDLIKLKNDFNAGSKFSVKVLVASRYLPSATLTNVTVNILPHFELNHIASFIAFLNEEFTETIQQRFSYLILEKTDGYPWFVTRFFKIYLTKRIEGNKSHSLQLAEHIFAEKSFWIMDSVFGKNQQSEFVEELIRLIGESEYRMKESFKQFIESDSSQTDLNNGYYNENDFLIRQSGFLKLDYLSDSFLNNGNFIMKNHYQNYIEQFLQ